MKFRYIWKRRQAMLKRGRRMALAHWRNRCEADDLDRWFDRHFAKYCAVQGGPNVKPTNKTAMRRVFWRDVFKELMPGSN